MENKRNVVLILVDQLRPDFIGPYGSDLSKHPIWMRWLRKALHLIMPLLLLQSVRRRGAQFLQGALYPAMMRGPTMCRSRMELHSWQRE